MARDVEGYRRLEGSARQYVEIASGEIVSRYERDKRVGALAESGFSSYGQRQRSISEYETKTNKAGEDSVKFELHGVINPSKALDYMVNNVNVKDTAFFSVRVKLSDGTWRSVATSDSSSIGTNWNAFMAEYELEPEDIDDIELVVLAD